jgi:DNA-binding winged helix-turn-helix (wHTH) protein/Tol biopolymer transport system component
MYRFGVFEADFVTCELRKSGLRIRIQEQPLRILEALLEKPGELVSREQLRDRLWHSDTFVDFERSLNAAVAKLRQSLGDSADRPIYIETVAKKGYRFIAPIIPMPLPEPVVESVAQAPPQSAPAGIPKPRAWIAALAGVLALGGAALYSWRSARPSPNSDPGPVSFTISMPPGKHLAGAGYFPNSVISPDGRNLVFLASGAEGPELYLRSMASETSQRLEGTEYARLPFWSPDSREIGFVSRDKLKTIAVRGGAERVLCDTKEFFGATWSKEGTILFGSDFGLYKIAATGGQREQVTKLDQARKDFRHSWPQFLPDGRRFLFFIAVDNDPAQSGVFLGSLDGGDPKLVFLNRTRAIFAPPDFLVYVNGSALVAQQWDIAGRRSLGEPHTIAKDVRQFTIGAAAFSLSENGVLAYRTGSIPSSQPVIYRRDGTRIRKAGTPGLYTQFVISPDEITAALQVSIPSKISPFSKIWILQMDSDIVTRFDFGDESYANPVWSSDSKRMIFSSYIVGGMSSQLWQWKVGEAPPAFFFADDKFSTPQDWSLDGKLLLYRRGDGGASSIQIGNSAISEDVSGTKKMTDRLRLSPDARHVAYSADLAGRQEVFIADFPGFKNPKQVSSYGGGSPNWNRSGKELFYIGRGGNVMSVTFDLATSLIPAKPKELFKPVPPLAAGSLSSSADGQRFYLLETMPGPVEDELHVITNWNAGIGR